MAAAVDDNLGSDADTPNKTPGARKTTTASASATTVGNTFFGPDFSPEAVLRGDGSQGRTTHFNKSISLLLELETKEAQVRDCFTQRKSQNVWVVMLEVSKTTAPRTHSRRAWPPRPPPASKVRLGPRRHL